MADIERKGPREIYCPCLSIIGDRLPNTTWLRVKAKKPSSINFNARDTKGSLGSTEDTSYPVMYFLLPNQLSYGIQHEWKEYTNIVGLAKDALGKAKAALGQAVGAIQGGFSGAGSAELNNNIYGIAQKNDNPVMYETSQRKILNVEITSTAYSDPESEVFYPIDLLQKLSTAESKGLMEFEYPYIFDVSIVSGLGGNISNTLFYIRNAALQSITPTFYAPYIKGYPCKVVAQLQFNDIDPLYRSHSWGGLKSKVNVTTNGGQ